jgi:hypothetical protein
MTTPNNTDQQFWTNISPQTAPATPCPFPQPPLTQEAVVLIQQAALQTANTRLNMQSGNFELKNVTTGLHNAPITQGQSGQETLVLEPQD